MSLLPSARIALDDTLNETDRARVMQDIKAVKGVISSAFNEKANAVAITYTGRATADVQKDVENIKGVKSFNMWRGY